MRRHIRIGNTNKELDVQLHGTNAVVTTAEGAQTIDLIPITGGMSLIVDHRVYDIVVSKKGHEVEMRNRTIHCVASVRSRATSHSETPPANHREVRTRMPGRIVKVFVQAGDEVEAGQALVLLEAMKMQNEIRAAAPAKVATLEVQEGDVVEVNALLLRLED